MDLVIPSVNCLYLSAVESDHTRWENAKVSLTSSSVEQNMQKHI